MKEISGSIKVMSSRDSMQVIEKKGSSHIAEIQTVVLKGEITDDVDMTITIKGSKYDMFSFIGKPDLKTEMKVTFEKINESLDKFDEDPQKDEVKKVVKKTIVETPSILPPEEEKQKEDKPKKK